MANAPVTDLYQASYLLLSGCELTGIECIPTAGSVSCGLSFRGEGIEELLAAWWAREAVVNLWAFRSAYNQVNSYVHQAKKSYALTAGRRSEGGEP